jgi:hypothetical protein
MQQNSHPVIVLGDLNDTFRSDTTQIISGQPPWELLPRKEKDAVWDVLLWSTQDIQKRVNLNSLKRKIILIFFFFFFFF